MNIIEIIFLTVIFVFSLAHIILVFYDMFSVGNNQKCATCAFAAKCGKGKGRAVAFLTKKRYYKIINKK
ncbi:MAG: hypothetical protein PHI66_04560 [Candidatus Pacebacteria bacterium]|nr:hypothetical protein [Candidatus Paceibacterota bacterium]